MKATNRRGWVLAVTWLLACCGQGRASKPSFLGHRMAHEFRPLEAAVPATDSAAAATAMATGHKTEQGNIAWAPGDDRDGALPTIAEWMRGSRGASIGVVTTVPFNHATPAAFIAHNVHRNNYSHEKMEPGFTGLTLAEEIVRQARPDVVIGAGHPSYSPGYLPRILLAELRASSEYVLAERQPGLSGDQLLREATERALQGGKKLFGLYGGKDGYMEHPVPAHRPGHPSFTQMEENPSLATATATALRLVGSNPSGGFLLVEGGDIDWANHKNDFPWMIGAMARFEQAVQTAVRTVELPGDSMDWSNTLLVVTSDHGNSYMRLNAGKPLGKGELPVTGHEVVYGTTGHTNELVTLAARGAGAELFLARRQRAGRDIVDNTSIYQVARRAVEQGQTRYVVLMIGDGMQFAHEVAASRYLYGTDGGLSWHQEGFSIQLWCTTWNVETYNRYALSSQREAFQPAAYDANVGYDPAKGGLEPEVFTVPGDPRRGYYLELLEGYPWGADTILPVEHSASGATTLATDPIHRANHDNDQGIHSISVDVPQGRSSCRVRQRLDTTACRVVTPSP